MMVEVGYRNCLLIYLAAFGRPAKLTGPAGDFISYHINEHPPDHCGMQCMSHPQVILLVYKGVI